MLGRLAQWVSGVALVLGAVTLLGALTGRGVPRAWRAGRLALLLVGGGIVLQALPPLTQPAAAQRPTALTWLGELLVLAGWLVWLVLLYRRPDGGAGGR